MTHDSADALRDRLIELRADALSELAAASPVIDAGMLRLIADITVTLAVLDAEAQEPR
jgi:hypothetical protein